MKTIQKMIACLLAAILLFSLSACATMKEIYVELSTYHKEQKALDDNGGDSIDAEMQPSSDAQLSAQPELESSAISEMSAQEAETAEEVAQPDEETIPEPEPEPLYEEFQPHCTEETNPDNFIILSEIEAYGEVVDTYTRENPISMLLPEEYSQLEGIFTFRGDNFRSGSAYGTAEITEKKIEDVWTIPTSSLVSATGSSWSGTGWTGQPLLVTWPKSTRQIMNMYDWAKEADELTEMIYAAEDGYIYFNEVETGKETREKLFFGYTFKGSGSVDPRGYPVLYVGAGVNSYKGNAAAFAISLIDYSTLFTFGAGDTFASSSWTAFDSSPLVDVETDTLIWPGEDGVLYLVDLNSNYDEASGTLTMEPEYVKWRYRGERTGSSKFWVGMEDSAVVWQGYLIVADNGGYLMCIDLETLQLVWVQDVLDDTNCSPVMELENGHPYIYISTSYHLGWRGWGAVDIPVWKIDAETGEIIWSTVYPCYSQDGISGGVQGTIAVGKQNLSDYIYVPMAMPATGDGGLVVCLRKDTGEVVWETQTYGYSWGSPTAVYTESGDGYLLYASINGRLYLTDGLTGEVLDSFDLTGHCEATVAVYNNMFIIGQRSGGIRGMRLK